MPMAERYRATILSRRQRQRHLPLAPLLLAPSLTLPMLPIPTIPSLSPTWLRPMVLLAIELPPWVHSPRRRDRSAAVVPRRTVRTRMTWQE